MTGWKDLSECDKTRHGETLKLKPKKNGGYSLIGINTCKKPCCPNCLKILLRKQEKSIQKAIQYARENNLQVTLWTFNLPKNNQNLMFQRIKLHNVISDFLRTSTRNSKEKPINKVLKEINKVSGSVGYIYRNETNFIKNFNPHIHLADFREKSLTEVQQNELKESLLKICERNGVFISKKQSYSVKDIILNFRENFNVGYLTKISDNDAVKLKEVNPTKYQEYCESQILLNRKSNERVLKIPLIYWKKGFKKLVGVKENKTDGRDDDFISIPKLVTDFMIYHKIEPSKLLKIIDSTGIEILQNENIFELLRT